MAHSTSEATPDLSPGQASEKLRKQSSFRIFLLRLGNTETSHSDAKLIKTTAPLYSTRKCYPLRPAPTPWKSGVCSQDTAATTSILSSLSPPNVRPPSAGSSAHGHLGLVPGDLCLRFGRARSSLDTNGGWDGPLKASGVA